MRLPFQTRAQAPELIKPEPPLTPKLDNLDFAALYRAARVGGDFFEFVPAGPGRLVFLLLDIAGKRDQALHIAAAVQTELRSLVPQLFQGDDLNEADAVTELTLHLNQKILQAAGGVRCAPAFIGCYADEFGIISYIAAGHVPALVRDAEGISVLEASGLPLGLFSHSTHDAQVCALEPGGTMLLVSRGLLELKAGGEEFGLEHLKEALTAAPLDNAHDLCSSVLHSVGQFLENGRRRRFLRIGNNHNNHPVSETDSPGENDVTTLALIRAAAKAAATSGS